MSKILSILFFTIIITITGIFMVQPRYQSAQSLQAKINQTNDQIKYRENYFSGLRQVSQELDKYQESISKIDAALPAKASLPTLFLFLQRTSSENGLILKEISFSSPVPIAATGSSAAGETVGTRQKYTGVSEEPIPSKTKAATDIQEVNFQLRLSGSYSALKNFLSSLEKSSKIWEVASLDLSSEEKVKEKGKEEATGEEAGVELFSINLMLKTHSY